MTPGGSTPSVSVDSTCPLCGKSGHRPSWLGATAFQGREFLFVECLNCGSLYCDPMPDETTLAAMYGKGYAEAFTCDTDMADPKEPGRVLQCLAERPAGTFVDFGCGRGELLTGATELGWRAVGIEFDPNVARKVTARTGARVVSHTERDSLDPPIADVLHLGDVLEHLTRMETQMPEVLRLLKPGGLLIAQGPLENNGNLFVCCLRLIRRLRPRCRTEMAPYHVMLATARGQKALFDRFSLETVVYEISEVSWPAPDRLSASNRSDLRAIALFLLRRCSRALTRLRRRAWGNRYFYTGRLS
jgi:SAM-dependent methyltransferase